MSSKKIKTGSIGINNTAVEIDDATIRGETETRLMVGSIWQANSEDVDSIDTRVSLEESTQASAETSLNTRVGLEETNRSTDVDSLDTRVSLEESTQASAEASINTRLDLEEKTTQVATIALTSGESSIEIDFESDLGMTTPFASTPAVAGTMRCTDADAAIIIPMLAGSSSTTECKFVFSEEVGNNYKLDIIVTD